MGAFCGIDQELEEKVAESRMRIKLEQLQNIIKSEEQRNFKLIHRLEALCDANGDLIAKNRELVAERKDLVRKITESQKKLEKLHKAFLTVDITADKPSNSQCN